MRDRKGPPIVRVGATVEGIVQGVGFRPFVYRLAAARGLSGWVRNGASGVLLEVEGAEGEIRAFLQELRERAPPLAAVGAISAEELPAEGREGFAILESGGGGDDVQIAPDGDVCPDCLRELFDPADRRYRYPFINCTNCGPRYTVVTGVPYDRPFTTMARFPLCPECRAEYEDPADRRVHAQPVACPACGPRLRLLDGAGAELGGDPLDAAVALLKEGRILALKGLGGYHLAVDACNGGAVRELRRRKERDEKPFALMSPGLDEVLEYAVPGAAERLLLQAPERPIVLLPKRAGNPLSPLVAPANGYFGVMLPYTPLHHLLLRGNFLALVMTSGNLSDEPIAYRDGEARERLARIAGAFLVHDREIHVRTDDSVLRVFDGRPVFLRRSRGYVPRPVALPAPQKRVLAVGGELKAAVCLTRADRAFPSQHVGDLKNEAVLRSLEETVEHLERILAIEPEVVAHDLHPDYLSTVYAQEIPDLPRVAVQHHHAHLASCMAENGLEGEVIGVIFDGTGLGTDGTIWGGEFLVGGYGGFERRGRFRPVPLPGGDAAVREPFRMALSYLNDVYGRGLFELPLPFLDAIPKGERAIFLTMLERRLNSPLTSSCGRLFDAVAALLGLRSRVSYEGQAAIELEALAERCETAEAYPFRVDAGSSVLGPRSSENRQPITDNPKPSSPCLEVDFRPMLAGLVRDLAGGTPAAELARRFHDTLAGAVGEACQILREGTGLGRVALSGGVFQNRLLTEGVLRLLAARGFQVFTQRLVPPNDGGLALGQAVIAGRSS
ncbi:MAG: carbamoyltransferase HypF [Deltaproteobacteria bacterium]|nr:carbamoyltransferase HypF [Deltaproteobacteria bacterium]